MSTTAGKRYAKSIEENAGRGKRKNLARRKAHLDYKETIKKENK